MRPFRRPCCGLVIKTLLVGPIFCRIFHCACAFTKLLYAIKGLFWKEQWKWPNGPEAHYYITYEKKKYTLKFLFVFKKILISPRRNFMFTSHDISNEGCVYSEFFNKFLFHIVNLSCFQMRNIFTSSKSLLEG